MPAAPATSVAAAERAALDEYMKNGKVQSIVEDLVQSLLEAKPADPKQFLLNKIEQELSAENDELPDADLQQLFTVARKISSEIMPRESIELVISETRQLLNCDIVSLFVLERKSNMLLLYASNLNTPIKVSKGQGIAGSVFNGQKTVNILDCYKDRRFDNSFDTKTGYVTRSLIAVPILDYEGEPCGVIQAINKLPKNFPPETDMSQPAGTRATSFQLRDEKILLHLTQHVAIAMRNSDVYREAIGASERATGLLNTIQSLSQDLGTQSLLLTITMHANKIVSAQRSTVFLLDEQLGQLWSVSTDTGDEIRIPKTAGIAGQCCCEAVTINIPDAYADSRFNQAVDKKMGFKTQSILALPIFDEESSKGGKGNVVGVIQMINKVSFDGQLDFFDDTDVEIMELFATFVGPKLTNSAMLKAKGGGPDSAREADSIQKSVDSFPSSQSRHDRPKISGLAMEGFAEGEEDEEEEDEAAI